MTTSSRRDDGWSDDRLEAAFRARAASAPLTPDDIADGVLAELAVRRGRVRTWSWIGAAAALVLVAVLAGSAVIGPRPAGPTVPPAGASGFARSSERPTPTGPSSADVIAALGGPIDVTAALAVRTSDDPDREVVVRGFLSPGAVTSCPAIAVGTPPFLACPWGSPWLMENAEIRVKPEPGSLGLNPPVGPAFYVSFVAVDVPAAVQAGARGDAPADSLVVGHFNDRRAALCEAPSRDLCASVFIVDRVAAIGGQTLDVQTFQRDAANPSDHEADVDALVGGVAPGVAIQSRSLLSIRTLLEIEPILINDSVVPHFANQDALVWLVTATGLRGAVPVARTFALIDGSNWFAEITADGAQLLDRVAVTPPIGSPPALPTAEPAAFRDAPREIAGVRVTTIGVAMQERQATMDNLGRDEFAIQAWYVAPDPSVMCNPALPALHAPTPPCDEARHWLLDDPQQYGAEPGQLRRAPAADLFPPVLNPIVPVDVPMEVGPSWHDGVPFPQPVIVLGHFEDNRVDAYAGNVYFVVDALAWTPGQPSDSLSSVVRLTGDATEDPESVIARVGSVNPAIAGATWLTAVGAADFAAIDSRAVSMPELTSGTPVWIVRSLVPSEMDGRQRLAVQWAWTADGGSRVWWTPTADSGPDLGTTLDLHDIDTHTSIVRVFDYLDQVESVSAGGVPGAGSWRAVGPVQDLLEVARGRTNREVVVRWSGLACDPIWRIDVGANDDLIVIQPWRSGDCEGRSVKRIVTIVFDHAVDLDKIRTGEECCG